MYDDLYIPQDMLMGVASVDKRCMSSAPCCGKH